MRTLISYILLAISAIFGMAASAQVIETEADYAVIMDYETGEVLWHKNGFDPMIPASMTKMMTAHLVFDRLRTGELELTDQFTVSENAWRVGGWASGGSTMGLGIGDQPTVEELLRGVVILSGNDACIVLAEGISGTEAAFAREMTATAQRIGLTSASFENATGLDSENHRISSRDLAMLARLTISDYPEFYGFYSELEYEWRGISQPNRNPVLGRVEGADGLKTGHLSVSGYGLTASAERDGTRRIIVINGMASEADRAREAERLMRLAFTAFDTRILDVDTTALPDLPVWQGTMPALPVQLGEPLRITGYSRAFADATVEIVYEAPLAAPITEGTQVATLVVSLPDAEAITAPVIANASVDKIGFVGLVLDGLNQKLTGGQ